MIKVDFHVHTIPTFKDAYFEFDLKTLMDYVTLNKIDCIAITNHNVFNIEQFNDIVNNLNITVLPGLELDIEDAHLLIIGDKRKTDELTALSNNLKEIIKDKKDFISYEKFVEIFPTYKDYLLIPHYHKKPSIKESTLNKFGDAIKCGEVPNAKKFQIVKKNNDILVPVVFSDFRPSNNSTFPNKYTYIDSSNNFSSIKANIYDRNKVYINRDKLPEEIEYLPDGSTISDKINIIVGIRTSGKTYTLDKILNSFDDSNCLYIKQFELTGSSENHKFDELISNECCDISEKFYNKLKPIIDKILNIDIKSLNKKIEDQLESLKVFAETQNLDEFAKCAIFSEQEYQIAKNNGSNLIEELKKVYSNDWHNEIVEKYITRENVKKLIQELTIEFLKEKKNIKLKEYTNEIIREIKKSLSANSSSDSPETIEIFEYFIQNQIIKNVNEKFKNFCDEKKNIVLSKKQMQMFKTITLVKPYTSVSEVKKTLKISYSITDIFNNYYKKGDLCTYIWKLHELGIQASDISKACFKIEHNVKNRVNETPSGGEKAEYNLLKIIDNANKYDCLLIDEPEASFDNPFINNNIVELLKRLSKKTTVCISTHNSTLAMMLNPSKIIYTENINGNHKVYYGKMGDKEFISSDGKKVISFDKIMDVLESGVEVYKEKEKKYETFRN